MAQYTIHDLEQLSGIKAHTIRIWEKRYGLVKPERTSTNIRIYNDADLKKILNISLLSRHGFRISKIARLSDEELNEKVLLLGQHSHSYNDHIDAFVAAMIELDGERFYQLLSTSIMKIGFEETFIHIIYPFLEKVGILWQAGTISPAQEHFISNLIRQKLIVTIDGALIHQKSSAKKFLLYLPEGEFHELGLLFYQYLIVRRGHKTLYLGPSVPRDDLISVFKRYQPDFLVSFFVTHIEQDIFWKYMDFLNTNLTPVPFFLSGQQVVHFSGKLPSHIVYCATPVSFLDELRKRNIG